MWHKRLQAERGKAVEGERAGLTRAGLGVSREGGGPSRQGTAVKPRVGRMA